MVDIGIDDRADHRQRAFTKPGGLKKDHAWRAVGPRLVVHAMVSRGGNQCAEFQHAELFRDFWSPFGEFGCISFSFRVRGVAVERHAVLEHLTQHTVMRAEALQFLPKSLLGRCGCGIVVSPPP